MDNNRMTNTDRLAATAARAQASTPGPDNAEMRRAFVKFVADRLDSQPFDLTRDEVSGEYEMATTRGAWIGYQLTKREDSRILTALEKMVAAYREGCADKDEPDAIQEAFAAIQTARTGSWDAEWQTLKLAVEIGNASISALSAQLADAVQDREEGATWVREIIAQFGKAHDGAIRIAELSPHYSADDRITATFVAKYIVDIIGAHTRAALTWANKTGGGK